MAENGYIGRISNAGAQRVHAPIAPKQGKAKNTVVRGGDLRIGKGTKGK